MRVRHGRSKFSSIRGWKTTTEIWLITNCPKTFRRGVFKNEYYKADSNVCVALGGTRSMGAQLEGRAI